MKLRYSMACCLLAMSSMATAASSGQGYYRDPALSGNTLVFTAEGDLWVEHLGDKHARRLTSQPDLESQAALSPDAKTVAFVASYEGAPEVYVMPISGGVPRRVTFENSRVRLQGWTKNGKILYATDNAVGPSSYFILREVDPQTLKARDIPLADASEGAVSQDGKYLYFTRFGLQVTGDHLKVYRGGAQGQLWRYTLGSNDEALHLSDPGSVSEPMAYAGRVYYVSDADGNPNLWSMAADGSDRKQ